MTLGRAFALIGVAILVLATNVAASVLYMVVYGNIIDPGHEAKYYQDHIQIVAPYSSIVAGIPIMFLAGWWVSGWWRRSLGIRGALFVWLAYTIIDISILLFAGLSLRVGILFVLSFATKLAAGYWGASARLRNHAEQSGEPESPKSPILKS